MKDPRSGPKRLKNGRFRMQFAYDEVYRIADAAIKKIRRGKLDPAKSLNNMIAYLRKYGMSNNSIIAARTWLFAFFQFARLRLDMYDLNRAVTRLSRVYVAANRLPTREQVRSLLLASDLKMQVFISMLISTGARPGEIQILKKDQIDFAKTPVQVHLKANKIYRNRIAFLSSETVMLLKEYLMTRAHDHEHIFSGYHRGSGKARDEPVTSHTVWSNIRRAFSRLKMNEKYDNSRYYFHPYVFRILNLDILKTGGFPSDWAEYLVGHSISYRASYLSPISAIAEAWVKHDHKFCFLTSRIENSRQSVGSIVRRDDQSPMIQNSDSVRTDLLEAGGSTTAQVATGRWRSRTMEYVKTNVASADYDKALAAGFTIFDSLPSGLRVMRRRFRGVRKWMRNTDGNLTWKQVDLEKSQ